MPRPLIGLSGRLAELHDGLAAEMAATIAAQEKRIAELVAGTATATENPAAGRSAATRSATAGCATAGTPR